MQYIKNALLQLILVCPFMATAQSSFLPTGDKAYELIDRLEIKQQTNTDLNFSTLKPYNRKYIVEEVMFLDSIRHLLLDSSKKKLSLTRIDEYNLNQFYMNNREWKVDFKEADSSRKPILKSLYKTRANLVEVNSDHFFLAINPLLQLHAGKASGGNESIYLQSLGLNARGIIGKRLGFYTSITDNRERGPLFFQQKVNELNAVPGVGYYKAFNKTGVNYLDIRGYLTFNAARYVDIQFGYDKNFIGNGYRSLFLSDFGNSYLFAKLNTRIWKFNYQNLFMELKPQFAGGSSIQLEKKYAVMHHLSINLTKWLNVGIFEAVMFGRKDRFDLMYMNPIIFYRHVESTIGSQDNALAGFDFKANVARRLQFYGQFLLDEFKLSQIRANTGWFANKWGLQLGAKYVDAFGISNLDLQLESNRVRPFTYTHYSLYSNYTHYNQPLAHPLGANFQEFIGLLKYQPAIKWYINGRIIYYTQGLDSLNGRNFGAAPFLDYNTRQGDYGYTLAGGRKATCLNTFIQLSYEVKDNLYLDLCAQHRNYKVDKTHTNSTLLTAGIRFNIAKRDYDY